jgi:hypothetical protein
MDRCLWEELLGKHFSSNEFGSFLLLYSRIGWAGAKSSNDKPIKPKDGPRRTDTAQIHVSFISKQVAGLITEETLRSLFGHYGTVVDVTIKKSRFDQVSTFLFTA